MFLSKFVSKSPINEKTEISIENYLMDLYTKHINENKDKSVVDGDLFINKKVRDFIFEARDVLIDYLKNFQIKSFKTSKIFVRKNSYYY